MDFSHFIIHGIREDPILFCIHSTQFIQAKGSHFYYVIHIAFPHPFWAFLFVLYHRYYLCLSVLYFLFHLFRRESVIQLLFENVKLIWSAFQL